MGDKPSADAPVEVWRIKLPDGSWRVVSEEEMHAHCERVGEQARKAFDHELNRPLISVTPDEYIAPPVETMAKVLSWLQAKVMDRSRHKMADARYTADGPVPVSVPSVTIQAQELLDWLVTIGAPVASVVAECEKRGWLNELIRSGPGWVQRGLYGIDWDVLDAPPAVAPSGARPVDDSEDVVTPETLVLKGTASVAMSALVQQAKAVYISYKCGDDTDAGRKREAFIDRLDTSLQTAGYNVRRVKRDIGYKDSIRKFMDELGRGHCIVVVLNNEYLRSRFCMYELVQIYLNRDFRKRIVPVVLPDVAGPPPMQRLKVVKFWSEQRDQHQQEFALNLGDSSHEGFSDFDRVRQIAQNCDAALSHVFDMNYLNQTLLEANDFRLLKQAIDERMEEPSAQAGRP